MADVLDVVPGEAVPQVIDGELLAAQGHGADLTYSTFNSRPDLVQLVYYSVSTAASSAPARASRRSLSGIPIKTCDTPPLCQI